jgi:hypothetical protein
MPSRRRRGPGRTTCPFVETLVCMVRQSYLRWQLGCKSRVKTTGGRRFGNPRPRLPPQTASKPSRRFCLYASQHWAQFHPR